MKFILRKRGKFTDSLDEKSRLEIEEDLKNLQHIIAKSKAGLFLTGGFAFAFNRNSFYRFNRDFDIGLFTDNFDSFIQNLKYLDYTIVRRIAFTHISPRNNIDLVVNTNASSISNKNNKHLRLLRESPWPITYAQRRTDYMDLFLYEKQGDQITLVEEDLTLSSSAVLPLNYHILSSGSKIPYPQIDYLRFLKSKSKEAVDQMDLAFAELTQY